MGLYSVLVWFEGTLHGFDWLLYGVSGVLSFSFGLLGGTMAVRRKNQTMALGAVSLSLFANVIAVHASLDAYQLPIPWALILPTLAFSLISVLLIGNADDQFQNLNKSEPPENHN
jgi:cyanate permease